MFKIFFAFIVSAWLLSAGPVLAVEMTPDTNPFCWAPNVCQAQFNQTFPNIPFTVENWEKGGPDGQCGESLGVCIPPGQASLSIKIDEVADVKNLADYIKLVFTYLVGIGGIVAVVLIIKGGFEWMTSAGSPERVKQAHATIGGAVFGLIILLGSYLLLFTINPDLVRLKLPGVYMIKPQEIIDMAEGNICWTNDPTNAACTSLGQPGEFVCRPLHTDGPLMAGMEKGITFLMTSAIPIPGGQIIGTGAIKAAGWTAGKLGATAGKFSGYFFKTPTNKIVEAWAKLFKPKEPVQGDLFGYVAKEITKDASGGAHKAFGQAVATTFKQGSVMAGGVLAVSASAVTTYFVSGEIYDLLFGDGTKGKPGICSKTLKLPEGMLCNVLIKPSDCASGACVKVVGWQGWVSNVDIGVCSPGGAGNPCNKESVETDCGTVGGPFKCFDNQCSDGSFNKTCESDADCQKGLTCKAGSIFGGASLCLKTEIDSGEQCQVAADPGKAGGCKAGFICIVPFSQVPVGACSDKQIGSPCYHDNDCVMAGDKKIGCFGGSIDKPYKAGSCLYFYYNNSTDVPDEKLDTKVLNTDNFVDAQIKCDNPNSCPNLHCLKYNESYKHYCAGQ